MKALRESIESLYSEREPDRDRARAVFSEFRDLLGAGNIRAAQRRDGVWVTNQWVKKGILLGFRIGELEEAGVAGPVRFFDKSTLPLKELTVRDGVRLVPGGSSIRAGAFVAPGVICMPPMYVNIGACVGSGTLVDSHALVGSCAQIGERVHLSAGAQIGGVLEPVGALPVIIEDDVLVGGNCGVYEGTVVSRSAVLGAGVILTGATAVYDLVNERVLRRTKETPLIIPEGAVVIPGSRKLRDGWGAAQELSIATPVIVKYRDEKTDLSTVLEGTLR
ncbi:MAG: 2,3,4,5-tetrahydropyridine-2,6-dicarboxylate N-succinyltransferase [Ignavibacteria bacterium]|nr:2,3,4,5-tetrahydropyridine-2,6-dicarboxylate N-succinyltransferase [Ignavibacteria bacterium]